MSRRKVITDIFKLTGSDRITVNNPKNIFEGVKFSDKFVTRDGRNAVYIIESDFGYPGFNCYACAVEGETELYHYDYSGECVRGIEFYNENDHIPFDIVSRYKEPINEDKLDELAKDFAYKEVSSHYEAVFHKPLPTNRENFGFISCENAYKAGYRKAKED